MKKIVSLFLISLLVSVSVFATGVTVKLDNVRQGTNATALDFSGDVAITGYAKTEKEIVIGLQQAKIDLTIQQFTNSSGENLTSTSTPGFQSDNSSTALVWADSNTTPAQVMFRVPGDYASGASFRLFVDESDSTTPNQVDFRVYVNSDNVLWDSAASDQTPVALTVTAGTPEEITLTVGTDFANLSAGDYVTLDIWRDNVAGGTGDLEVYHGLFVYTN